MIPDQPLKAQYDSGDGSGLDVIIHVEIVMAREEEEMWGKASAIIYTGPMTKVV